MPTVVLLGTLDTKGREYRFLKEQLAEDGVEAVVIDVGVLGEPPFPPDFSASDVAQAAGTALEALRSTREGSDTRAAALAVMERGALAIVRQLHAQGRCDGILGAAGSGGSSVISAVMQAMPVGLPKLLVTTMARNAAAFFGMRDVAVMHSVTDIAGLNRVSRKILGNAAAAMAGMAKAGAREDADGRPLVAVTMFGVTTPGVLRVQERLEEAGFDTIVFHAVGTGGRAMEEMIEDGLIDGVVDYTTSELTDELLGGIFPAGPDRLTAAGRRGLPQVVVPGAIEVLNFGARDTVPKGFDVPERRLVVHNPYVCAVRTTKEEAAELGRILAEKLNRAKGPSALLLPLGGFDSYQRRPDGPYIDEEADNAFLAAAKGALGSKILCREHPGNVNDPDFADLAADTFLQLWRERRDRNKST